MHNYGNDQFFYVEQQIKSTTALKISLTTSNLIFFSPFN